VVGCLGRVASPFEGCLTVRQTNGLRFEAYLHLLQLHNFYNWLGNYDFRDPIAGQQVSSGGHVEEGLEGRVSIVSAEPGLSLHLSTRVTEGQKHDFVQSDLHSAALMSEKPVLRKQRR